MLTHEDLRRREEASGRGRFKKILQKLNGLEIAELKAQLMVEAESMRVHADHIERLAKMLDGPVKDAENLKLQLEELYERSGISNDYMGAME